MHRTFFARRPWATAGVGLLALLMGSCLYGAETTEGEPLGVASPELTTQPFRPYEAGAHQVATHDIGSAHWFFKDGPPKSMRVYVPKEPGTYPLVVLVTCFACETNWHDSILSHLASHGFVVAVPKLHDMLNLVTVRRLSFADATALGGVYDWMKSKFNDQLAKDVAPGVKADLTNVGLLGYSSGGKAAWLAASQKVLPLKAIAGIAPVDNPGDPFGLMPEPTLINGPLDVDAPALILGTGYDAVAANSITPICAPEGHNHVQFFEASRTPTWHVVALDNGHTDVIDQEDSWLPGWACPTHGDRQQMRDLVKGMLAAFYRGALLGETEAYATLRRVDSAPAKITFEEK